MTDGDPPAAPVGPADDHAEITAIAAAHVFYDLVTLMARTVGR